MLTFSCAPSGARPAGARPQQPVEHGRRDVGQHVAADGDALVAAASAQRTATPSRPGSIAVTSAPQRSSAPAARAAALERAGDRAHAADRHVPVAGAVADHVVEEAAVLAQVGVVRRRRTCRSARRSARRRARASSSRQSSIELADRALDERLPRGVVADAARAARRASAAARSASGRARARRGRTSRRGAPSPRSPPGRRSRRQRGARCARGPRRRPAGRAPGRRAAACRTRSAAGASRTCRPSSSTIALRQQADEVGVARQARVDAGPRALGDRRAADVVAALEHEHRAPGARQVGGGDEAVVAAADDHHVVSRSRAPSVREQVRVDRHEPVDVVHVAVELGDDDRVAARPVSARRCSIAARVALRPARAPRRRRARPCPPARVAAQRARRAPSTSASARPPSSGCTRLTIRPPNGMPRLAQLAVEEDRLLDRLALGRGDDEERRRRVGEQRLDALGALAEAVDAARPARGRTR